MHKQGKRIPEIKAAIDAKYAKFQQSR